MNNSHSSTEDLFISQKWGLSRWMTPFLVVAGSLLFSWLAYLQIYQAPLFDWNARRLVGPIAFAKGLPILPTEAGSPYTNGLNGLFQLLVYSPTALCSTPDTAIWVGSFISLLVFFLPLLVWLVILSKTETGLKRTFLPLVTTIMFILVYHSRSLIFSSSIVHADAPALGFSLLSLSFLWSAYKTSSNRSWILACLFGAMALHSKLTVAPALVAIFIFSIIYAGVSGLRWTILGIFFLTVFHILMGFKGGLTANFHYFFVAPFQLPLLSPSDDPNSTLTAVTTAEKIHSLVFIGRELIREYYPFLVAILIALGIDPRSPGNRATPRIKALITQPWVLPFVVSLFLLPSSIMGRAKSGGALNTLSPFVYFLLVSFVTLLWKWTSEIKTETGKWILQGSALILILTQTPFAWSTAKHNAEVITNNSRLTFEFSKKHPNQVYFPDYPLSTLLTDGAVYHSGMAIAEHENQGYVRTIEEFRKNVPPDLKWIAFQGEKYPPITRRLPEFNQRVELEELKGWTVYTR